MKATVALCLLGLLATGVVSTAHAESARDRALREQAARDRATLRANPPIGRLARDVSPIIDRTARQHATEVVGRSSGSSRITSTDRSSTGPLASRAHERGAIDATTRNMRSDAPRISSAAGPGYTTIHEQPHRATVGPSADTHTIYRNGAQVNSKVVSPRATGEHIHVQPDYNSRLHEAVRSGSSRR